MLLQGEKRTWNIFPDYYGYELVGCGEGEAGDKRVI